MITVEPAGTERARAAGGERLVNPVLPQMSEPETMNEQ